MGEADFHNKMFIFSFLFYVYLVHYKTEAANCINNYEELKTSIINNSENIENLLQGFYPPNQSPSHILNVYYYTQLLDSDDKTVNETNVSHPHFEQPNNTANYIFQWVDSSTLLLFEWRLFDALSFGIAELDVYNISLSIRPFCDEDEAVKLLNMATVWVSLWYVNKTCYIYC